MWSHRIRSSLQREQRNVTDLLSEISTAQSDVVSRSAAALAQVCCAVITGEGPTVAGRVHFSRTLDGDDAALCARILILAGHNGDPVSRVEADVLFDINAAGGERRDGGRFDDLLAKAVMHHVRSACGRDVPRREIALRPETPMEAWTSAVDVSTEARHWLDMRQRELKASSVAAHAIATVLASAEQANTRQDNTPQEMPTAAWFDLAA